MATSLFFYDLETSGFSPRDQRIMQFGGQRTDMQLNPIGEPHNYLIKMTEDILPDPDAVLLTGITPQMTIAEGLTESEFLQIFSKQIVVPGTIFVGYNSIRFDDEFMRFLHWRNFYDPYEWHWADDCSRWDMLDVVRMTRALRPDGIEWPVDSEGKPVNQLGRLTAANGLDHHSAHDAVSDVMATIALAQLLRQKQPKLFMFLLNNRSKSGIKNIVLAGEPFVYTSGRYASEHHKTTVATTICENPNKGGVLVYDLRHDPTPFFDLPPEALAEMMRHFCHDHPCPHPRLPIKTLQFNRCPAVAPLSVLDADSQTRLHIDMPTIRRNQQILAAKKDDFGQKLITAVGMTEKKYQEKLITDELDADSRLYDGFISDNDKFAMGKLRLSPPSNLQNMNEIFADSRLNSLLPLYKARNFPKLLTDDDRSIWQDFCTHRLLAGKQKSRAAKYFARLEQLAGQADLTDAKKYLLDELQLYGQSILPSQD